MKLGIHICSELEWGCAKSILKIERNLLQRYPFGEYFVHRLGQQTCNFYQSGATKTMAAAACQFAIDTWQPDAIVNIGTCGGVGKGVKKLDLILADQTFQYDVVQRFGKPSVWFKKGLKTILQISWFDSSRISRRLNVGTIASADQDLDPEKRGKLRKEGALAADWESASIAKVCELNGIKCLILRGVTDIPQKGKTLSEDVQERDYQKNTRIIIKDLFSALSEIDFR